MLEEGATYGGSDNQVWAPSYTLYKILAGLMDVYKYTGNKKALDNVQNYLTIPLCSMEMRNVPMVLPRT